LIKALILRADFLAEDTLRDSRFDAGGGGINVSRQYLVWVENQ
jgi:fructose-1-phosphate kinase PfkB-like protein